MKIPVRLKKEPIVEAIWEVRFVLAGTSTADLLPGIVYQALSNKYPQFTRLPAAEIPVPLAEEDPKLRYTPRFRLDGKNQAILIGEHMVALSCCRPYPGWKKFSADICELVQVLESANLFDRLERFSLKYVNLLDLTQPPDLNCLNLELKIGEFELHCQPVQLRTEIRQKELVHIIQIASPAKVTIPSRQDQLRGVLLEVDSIRVFPQGSLWSEVIHNLDTAHAASKEMFFKLLTPGTLQALEPEYEDK